MEHLSLTGFAVDDTKALAVSAAVDAVMDAARLADPMPADLLAALTLSAARVIRQQPNLAKNPAPVVAAVMELLISLTRRTGS